MRIMDITNRFVSLDNRSGCDMRARWEDNVMTLRYRHDGKPIADIYDYKDRNNFRLRVYPRAGYTGRSGHMNRVHAVLRSVQMPDSQGNWDDFRYSAFIHYSLRIHDRKLNAEYELREDKPIEFAYIDGKLTMDYQALERTAFPNAIPQPVVEPNANSNLRSVTSRLTTILQGV